MIDVRRTGATGSSRVVRIALGASLLMAACSGDDRPPPLDISDSAGAPIDGCEDHDYRACDIAEASCRTGLFELTACVRQAPPGAEPGVEFIQRDELLELYLELYAEEELLEPSLARALVLLGLVAERDLTLGELAELSVDSIAGFYLPEEDAVFVVLDESMDQARTTLMALLVHEYVHAQQHADVDLGAALEDGDSSDTLLGVISVFEGEATLYQLLLLGAFLGIPQERLDVEAVLEELIFATDEIAAAFTSPHLVARGSFPYSYGTRFAYRAWQRGGPAAVRELYGVPPSTLEVVARGDDIQARVEIDAVAGEAPAAPAGFELVGDDTLGSWSLVGFLTQWHAIRDAKRFASAWRGDRLWVYAGDADAVTAVFRVRFDAEETAADVADTIGEFAAGDTAVAVSERDVVLVRTTEAGAAAAWLDALP